MDTIISFGAAFVSGIIHITIGHPFDTIKTLLQSKQKQIRYTTLFSGLRFPLIQNSVINSLTFGSNHYLQQTNSPLFSYMYCGVLSSIICTPLEEYKILKQYNPGLKQNRMRFSYSNTVHMFRHFHVVLLRELPATSLYFGVYEFCSSNLHLHPFIGGSLAGFLANGITYPIDTIKTRIQSGESSSLYSAYIKGTLWRGIVPCLARSILVNGINFSIYDTLMREGNLYLGKASR